MNVRLWSRRALPAVLVNRKGAGSLREGETSQTSSREGEFVKPRGGPKGRVRKYRPIFNKTSVTPIAGCRERLIGVFKMWVVSRQASSSNRQFHSVLASSADILPSGEALVTIPTPAVRSVSCAVGCQPAARIATVRFLTPSSSSPNVPKNDSSTPGLRHSWRAG